MGRWLTRIVSYFLTLCKYVEKFKNKTLCNNLFLNTVHYIHLTLKVGRAPYLSYEYEIDVMYNLLAV